MLMMDNEEIVLLDGDWHNVCVLLQRYWDNNTTPRGKRFIVCTLKQFYGNNFEKKLLGTVDGEYQPEIDNVGTDGEVLSEQYYGNILWECYFCKHRTNGEDIFEERILDNWSVPVCDECVDPDNRPCAGCFGRNSCICAEMFADDI